MPDALELSGDDSGWAHLGTGGYAWAPPLNGGFAVFELPSREEAIAWAARVAAACRCQQELRVFMFDRAS
jgi:hypothetical protein